MPPRMETSLADRALAVLDANWLGPARAPRDGSIPTSGAGTRHASPWARRGGTRTVRRSSFVRSSPASGATGCCRTSCSRTRPATSRDRSSGGRARRRRLFSAADVGHRPAADSCNGGARGVPARERTGPGREIAGRAAAETRGLARVPLAGEDARRRRAGRDLAPVGVRHGQLAAVGRGARAESG